MGRKMFAWPEKGGACHFLPESGYILPLGRNEEGEHLSGFRINPSAVTDDIATEHKVLAAFESAIILHNIHPFCIMASYTTGRCVALLQQISPKLTGQRALSFFIRMQKDRQERQGGCRERSYYSKLSRCKDSN